MKLQWCSLTNGISCCNKSGGVRGLLPRTGEYQLVASQVLLLHGRTAPVLHAVPVAQVSTRVEELLSTESAIIVCGHLRPLLKQHTDMM